MTALHICLFCGYVDEQTDRCPQCGQPGDWIPHEVWFGELTPEQRLRFARERDGPLAVNVERSVAEGVSDDPLL